MFEWISKLFRKTARATVPISIHPARIRWLGAEGRSRARCVYCDRDIEQEETKITYVSDSGNFRAKGRVWCSVCGAVYVFDNTEGR
jgi:uncharacterized Zn-finger protein